MQHLESDVKNAMSLRWRFARVVAATAVFALGACEVGEEEGVDEDGVSEDGVSEDDVPLGAGSNYLLAGETLVAHQVLYSSSGYLYYQDDGNLVFYNPWGQAIWNSQTWGTSPNVVIMQGDGNLVIYDASWTAVWSSRTSVPGSYLWLSDRVHILFPQWVCSAFHELGQGCPPAASFP